MPAASSSRCGPRCYGPSSRAERGEQARELVREALLPQQPLAEGVLGQDKDGKDGKETQELAAA
jgi:hypothetical protein